MGFHPFGIGESDAGGTFNTDTAERMQSPAVSNQFNWSQQGPYRPDTLARQGDVYQQRGIMGADMGAANGNMASADLAGNQNNQARAGQQDALSMYRNAAMGLGPSAAQAQMQQGNDAAMRQQMAMANSAQGTGLQRGAAMQQAQNNASGMAQNNAAAAAQLRAQEQQAGMAGYQQGAGALRGADLNTMQTYGQLSGIAGQQALGVQAGNQRSQAMNDDMKRYYDQLGMTAQSNQLASNVDYAHYLANNYNTQQQTQAGISQSNANHDMQLLSAAAGAASSGASAGISAAGG